MAFLLYFLVLLISAGGVLFGLDLMTSPLPRMPASVHIGRPVPLPMRRADHAPNDKRHDKTSVSDRALSPVYPASPGPSAKVIARAQAASVPKPESVQTSAPPQTDGAAVAASDAAPAQSSCDVQACSAAYHTFSAADCTYQPSKGPRRLCTKSSATVQTRAAALRLAPKHASRRPTRQSDVRWIARQTPERRGLFSQSRDDETNEAVRIVRQMTRGRDAGDIAVQRADGSIIIVHTGNARAEYR
jgi:hypothetical protein